MSPPCSDCRLPSAFCFSEADVLDRRLTVALGAGVAAVVPLGVELGEREDGDGVAAGDFQSVERAAEADDDAAADDLRAELADEFGRLLERLAGARDVVHDDAGVNLAGVDVLPEHSLAVLALGPVNLLGVQGLAYGEGDGDAVGAGRDDW